MIFGQSHALQVGRQVRNTELQRVQLLLPHSKQASWPILGHQQPSKASTITATCWFGQLVYSAAPLGHDGVAQFHAILRVVSCERGSEFGKKIGRIA